MIRNKISKQLYNLLPAYINATLNPIQRKIVAWWLDRDESARATAENLKTLQSAVQRQPRAIPPSGVLQRIQTQIQVRQTEPARTNKPFPNALAPSRTALGFPVLLLSLIALIFTAVVIWQTLPPGIVLQWSIEGQMPESFRIYRAEVNPNTAINTAQFELIEELPATGTETQYTFTDFRLLPGHQYLYRVEGLNAAGQSAASQTISGQGVDALPGQLAVLLVITFTVIAFWQMLRLRPPITASPI